MTDIAYEQSNFLKSIAVYGGITSASRLYNPKQSSVTDSVRLTMLSAVQAVIAMQQGEITSEEYASALADRCESLRHLNAFISFDRDGLLERAQAADKRRKAGSKLGLMHGLPVAIKDSINTKDLPTSVGTPALKNFRPKQNAPVADALFQQGALLLGKTNLHELSYGWTSNNSAFGPVRNPYDPSRIAGGSTGGTAAAVAARMVSSGLAADTCGSVRIPASLCGITALRPSTGRYPAQDICPVSPAFDTPGVHSRSVADLWLYDAVITHDFTAPHISSLKGVRLGISPEHFLTGLDSEVERVFILAMERLSAAGAVFIRAEIPNLAKLLNAITFPIQSYDAMPSLEKYLLECGCGVTAEQVYEEVASPRVKSDIDTCFRRGESIIRLQMRTSLPS